MPHQEGLGCDIIGRILSKGNIVMAIVKCKNCGASFEDTLAQCPYCGTMNKKGAYREFRKKISNVIDSLLGLKDEVQRSVSAIVLRSLLRSLIIVAVIVGLAFVCARFKNVNYFNDKEYDQEVLEKITWLDDNLDRLNDAYEKGDYKAVEKIYYENSRAASGWVHYPTYCLKKECRAIEDAGKIDAQQLQRALYILFYPRMYTGYSGISRVSEEDYDLICGTVIELMEKAGYGYPELEEIYKACRDNQGYLSYELVKTYVKEGSDGQL